MTTSFGIQLQLASTVVSRRLGWGHPNRRVCSWARLPRVRKLRCDSRLVPPPPRDPTRRACSDEACAKVLTLIRHPPLRKAKPQLWGTVTIGMSIEALKVENEHSTCSKVHGSNWRELGLRLMEHARSCRGALFKFGPVLAESHDNDPYSRCLGCLGGLHNVPLVRGRARENQLMSSRMNVTIQLRVPSFPKV
eukprot:3371048-Amphidinium_carterae.1